MEELWTVRCFDGATEQWTQDVNLSSQNMRMLLQMLLCRNLEHHEIIDSVMERRDLLDIRQDEQGMYTGEGLLHYTALRRE